MTDLENFNSSVVATSVPTPSSNPGLNFKPADTTTIQGKTWFLNASAPDFKLIDFGLWTEQNNRKNLFLEKLDDIMLKSVYKLQPQYSRSP